MVSFCSRDMWTNPLTFLCICRQKSSVLTPAKPWHCSIRLIFGRLDAYLTRLDEVYVIVNSASAYLRLEKIEIGGTHVRYRTYTHMRIRL